MSFNYLVSHSTYLKNLKSSNVKDPQERSSLSFCFIESFVHAGQDPTEKTLKFCLGQSFYGKVCLEKVRGDCKWKKKPT